MRSVFLQTLRSHRTGLAAVSLGLFLISLIIVYMGFYGQSAGGERGDA